MVSLMFTRQHTFIHVEGANELMNLCFGCNYLCDTETGNQGALFVRIFEPRQLHIVLEVCH